jgi:MFS family permease
MFAIIFTTTTLYTDIILLMIFRFGIGWTVGTFVAIIPSFIRDTTSKNVAPYFGTLPIINESLGGLLSFILGFALYEATGAVRETWIIMVSFNIIPLIIIVICIKCDMIYESPIYFLKNDNNR